MCAGGSYRTSQGVTNLDSPTWPGLPGSRSGGFSALVTRRGRAWGTRTLGLQSSGPGQWRRGLLPLAASRRLAAQRVSVSPPARPPPGRCRSGRWVRPGQQKRGGARLRPLLSRDQGSPVFTLMSDRTIATKLPAWKKNTGPGPEWKHVPHQSLVPGSADDSSGADPVRISGLGHCGS